MKYGWLPADWSRFHEIAKQYPQKKCKAIGLDLSKDENDETLGKMLEESKPDIKLLISNSGVVKRGNFDEAELSGQTAMCDLNVKGATAVTRLCLPYMKKGSVILETCSTSAFAPNPHLNVYSATKAYLMNFSTGLRQELKPRGFNVCAVHPGWMNTDMNAGARNASHGVSMFLPQVDVKKLASRSLAAARKGKASYTQGAFYKFYHLLTKVLPHTLIVRFSAM
ncbi:MAG: SDR family NAD(P)-dependent oxidoreductase [Oscillospiraceae bacterium]|jgi:short-subunit dehydrogenase|nr:SDR family NAD(P)-dependent oxidoreductase [Oscillospiraceae bacterium]MCI1990867.1 SDR family NAD(P)-dependent oxidoreductase [Oscillospiraceae bacterium]